MKRYLFLLAIALPGLLLAAKKTPQADSASAIRMQPKGCTLAKVQTVSHGKTTETMAVYNDTASGQAFVYLFSGQNTVVVDTLGPGLFDYPEVTKVYYANKDTDKEIELVIEYTIGARTPNANDDGYDPIRQPATSIYDVTMKGKQTVGVKKIEN